MRKHILITGGAGFIGSHLTDEFLCRGGAVTVLDNLRNGSRQNLLNASKKPGFNFIQGDVLNPKACEKYSRGIDLIYHLACLGVRHSLHSPLENHRVNAEGTLNMLEAARKHKIRFFYVSTSEIYGEASEFPLNETALPCPATVYGASKLAGEHFTRAYQKNFGLKAVVLRLFNNFGPRAHYEGDAGEMIPRTIVNLLYGKAPILFGDGKNTRDFFYVKDTARALADLVSVAGLNGQTINVGTGEEISMKQLTSKILLLMDKKTICPRYLAARPGDLPRLWVDAQRFYKLTRFKPAYTMEEGLKETIDYYRSLMKSKNLSAGMKDVNWIR